MYWVFLNNEVYTLDNNATDNVSNKNALKTNVYKLIKLPLKHS